MEHHLKWTEMVVQSRPWPRQGKWNPPSRLWTRLNFREISPCFNGWLESRAETPDSKMWTGGGGEWSGDQTPSDRQIPPFFSYQFVGKGFTDFYGYKHLYLNDFSTFAPFFTMFADFLGRISRKNHDPLRRTSLRNCVGVLTWANLIHIPGTCKWIWRYEMENITHIHIHIHACMHICNYIYMYMYMYIYIYMYMYVYVYIYICVCVCLYIILN